MKKVGLFFFLCLLAAPGLQARHFFLPQRNLFNFRPDLFVYGGPVGVYPLYPASFPCAAPYLSGLFPGLHSPGVYTLILRSPAGMEVVRANAADLIFQVSPSKALIFIDGKLIGNAHDFASQRDRYTVLEGDHDLRIELPGYKTFQTRMRLAPNRTLKLDIELEK